MNEGNTINGIDDIDAMLEKEFNTVEDDGTNNAEPETDEDVIYTEDDNETVEDDDDNSQEDVALGEDSDDQEEKDDSKVITSQTGDEPKANGEGNVQNTKPSKEDQKEFNFAQMRQENSRLKRVEKTVAEMAKKRGYDNLDKFIEDLTVADDTLEGQKLGIDPTTYREIMKYKRENEELKQQINESKFEKSVSNLRSSLDEVIGELELGDSQEATNLIMGRLEKEGYTVEQLLGSPNPKILIKGVLDDKIQEKITQNQVKKMEKLNKVADDKHIGNTAKGKKSLDDIIAQEMKEYKSDNYL